MNRSHLGAAALTFALVAASCGSDETATPVTTETDSAMETDGTETDGMEMNGMDMEGMNMGDASAVRADDVVGAALATGDFVLLDTRPQGFDDVTGTAWVARHPAGTTVTVELEGLIPDADYISHLHADTCANDGGEHYQFEIGGSTMPPNEVHLAFTSDEDGNGFMTAENHQIVGLDAVAFVVHPADLIDNKIACVDFVELEAGAAAAAIDAGVDPSLVDHDDMNHDDMDDMEESMLPSGFDIEALHGVDDQINEGTFDPATQGPIVNAALALVSGTPGLVELETALADLSAAIADRDAEAAAPLAAAAHDVAHDLEHPDNMDHDDMDHDDMDHDDT